MIAVIKTDVRECEVEKVLLFDDTNAMARYLVDEYQLTVEERKQIEEEQYALMVPNKDGNLKLSNLGTESGWFEFSRGTLEFETVSVDDKR